MADQNSNFPGIINDDIIAAISSAEQLLMSDEIPDDPLLNSLASNMMQAHHSYDGNHGTHFSGISFDENVCINNNNENNNFIDLSQNSTFGNPIQIPIWPPPPSPYSCTCCQTLRQIFHTNGTNVLKLDIHGRLGLISHAILERYNTDAPSDNHEYQMFDFCHESMLSVKQFLVQYCDDRKREGYIMLHDPLSNFYNALCIGFYSDGNFDDDVFLPETPREEMHVNQEEEGNNGVRVTKSNIASQRERTGRMKLKDVAGYFHLPINVASKQLKICASALKGICRKGGLSRWPHRKIKSIKSSISKKKQSLNSNDANERARASTEIQELQTELANIYQGNGGMVNSPSHE